MPICRLDQPEDCPSTFSGFSTPVEGMSEYTTATLAGHLILTENMENLGILWLESIDDFAEGECSDLRCDYRSRLVNPTLIELGSQATAISAIPTGAGSRVTIEVDTKPSTALHHLKPCRKKCGEKGHGWNSINEAIISEPQDDIADIVVAVERDRRNFSIIEGGNPHSTLKEWEDNGHLPRGWPELAVTGDIRPEDILRHLGVPTVILADHVPSVEQAKMTVENRFEQAMMLHNN